jgi:hypothetical protein
MCIIVLFSTTSTYYIVNSAASFTSIINTYSKATDLTNFYNPINDVSNLVKTYSITNLNVYFLTDGEDNNPNTTAPIAASIK